MEPIVIHLPNQKVSQKPQETALLAKCKYFKGEDECPYKDAASAEACFWNIERVAIREAALESSDMLNAAEEELARVNLPKSVKDAFYAPILQVAFVFFGKQASYPYWHPEFAAEFQTYLEGYGLNLV